MTGASGRVLVVDDNKVIRQLIRVNLELEGFEVVTAADGAECLEIVHRVQPDVVTLDAVMPRLDGESTAAQLRADPRTQDTRIVMVSAGAVPDGVGDAYLAKPFEPAELVETVRRLAVRRAASRPGDRPSNPGGPGPSGGSGGCGGCERPGDPEVDPPPEGHRGRTPAASGP